MFAFKFEVRTKKCPCKNKTVQQTNSQSFKVLSTGTNTCPQPWPPLINGLLELSPDRNLPCKNCVATLFRWSWKILSHFVANLSTTLHITFYQNRSSIVEVMMKKFWCVFMPHRVVTFKVWLVLLVGRLSFFVNDAHLHMCLLNCLLTYLLTYLLCEVSNMWNLTVAHGSTVVEIYKTTTAHLPTLPLRRCSIQRGLTS